MNPFKDLKDMVVAELEALARDGVLPAGLDLARVAPRAPPPHAPPDAAGDKKRPALRAGHIDPPGALRRLPAIWESGVPQRAARRACPAGRCAP